MLDYLVEINELLRSSRQDEGVFIQPGGNLNMKSRDQCLSLGLVLIVTYFATSFMVHVTKYILCWNWIGKKKEYKETEIKKKKIKKNIWNDWEFVFLL